MGIREVSEEEKKNSINRVLDIFGDIRNLLNTLEKDMESTELMVQASAVWIGGNLCTWYNDFRSEIAKIDQCKSTLNALETEIQEVIQNDSITASDSGMH